MSTIQKTLEFSKEADELVQGTRKFISSIRKAVSDGWQPAQDVPLILQAAFLDLVPAIQGTEKLANEHGENKRAFVRSFVEGASDLALDFIV